jgi:hypothetical protein
MGTVAILLNPSSLSDFIVSTAIHRNTPGNKPRDPGLAKVSKLIAIPSDKISPGDHPYLYDVQYIIGGKLSAIPRSELEYTTQAIFAGNRRKRSSTDLVELNWTKENQEKDANANQKKHHSVRLFGKRSLKEKVFNKQSTSTNVVPLADPYDRHRRELEKALLKLENSDRMGLFDGENRKFHYSLEPPTDFDKASPTTWAEIRRRLHSGYYVKDRSKVFSELKRFVMTPYLTWRENMGLPPTTEKLPEEIRFPKGVDWQSFKNDVKSMCQRATKELPNDGDAESDMVMTVSAKIISLVEDMALNIERRQESEMRFAECKIRYSEILRSSGNKEAAMQGLWRKIPFPERLYQRLAISNVLCDGLSELDQRTAVYELETSLCDRFVGLSYTYDDNGQSESWMKSIVNNNSLKQSKRRNNGYDEEKVAAYMQVDVGLVKAQVCTSMEKLLITVQDRVMTELGVLQKPEVRSVNWLDGDTRKLKYKLNDENYSKLADHAIDDEIHIKNSNNYCDTESNISLPPEVVEQPVWGIDCYTRKNIEACVEADFDGVISLEFIEKWLLPAINACPEDLAHDISQAAMFLEAYARDESDSKNLESDHESNGTVESHITLVRKALQEKLLKFAPPWLRSVAHQFRIAVEAIGGNEFCVHPKGHGSVVICSDGIPANTLVTHYRGEVYPPWRWGEKLDAIEEIQKKLGLKPHLPDFYNMVLERPQNDPRGYGLLFVDASRKAGLGSSFSHSCNPTCEVKVVALHGMLSLAITTLRHVEVGEELTFDYNAVTESLDEYQAAICLCGSKRCRGSFLHFATADCYQEILRKEFPLAARFASIAKSCTRKNLSEVDEKRLHSHGFRTATFGAVSYSHLSFPIIQQDSDTIKPRESLDNVPIWLLSFAAEILQYIEYERRALPIALVLKHLSDTYENKSHDNTGYAQPDDMSIQEQVFKDRIDSRCIASKRKRNPKRKDALVLKNISFEQADAEGWSSMEQRIHQLVQTLSRVGRVLDRHRDSLANLSGAGDTGTNIGSLHHPISIVPDEDVVQYFWKSDSGLWKTMKKFLSQHPLLNIDLESIASKYDSLDHPPYSNAAHARKLLSCALLELRQSILRQIERMKPIFQPSELRKRTRKHTAFCNNFLSSEESSINNQNQTCVNEDELLHTTNAEELDKLEATSDLLILYAHTDTFFEMKPYLSFSSSPIDVYARELGNLVSKFSIDAQSDFMNCTNLPNRSDEAVSKQNEHEKILRSSIFPEKFSGDRSSHLDEVVASLSVQYKGDYVISLLLQWFSGGINLKPGLPDIYGCIMLPSLSELWNRPTSLEHETNDSPHYDSTVRSLLLSCLEDLQKRGEPWPHELKKHFLVKNDYTLLDCKYVGSPMLDFFITGDESVMSHIIREIKVSSKINVETQENAVHQKSVDELRLSSERDRAPIQAICSWARCDSCLKWRKLPWHVHPDDLPEQFLCKNNQWNPNANSCELPEEEWDECDAPIGNNKIPESAFVQGARFDVRRGNNKFAEAVIVETDFSAADKQAKFHFLRISKERDEWIDIRSSRIAPHKTYIRYKDSV